MNPLLQRMGGSIADTTVTAPPTAKSGSKRERNRHAPFWLVACVLTLHLVGLDWVLRKTTGSHLLQHMAEPDFHQQLLLSDATAGHGGDNPMAPGWPPASTVGQVIQARTVVPPARRDPASVPPKDRDTRPQHKVTPAPPVSKVALKPDDIAPAASPPIQAPEPPPEPTDTQPMQPPALASPPLTEKGDPPPGTQPAPFVNAASHPPQRTALPEPVTNPPTTTDAAAWLAQWPRNTRLNYRLKGYYRGDFYGNARVQWQRSEQRYQVQINVNVALLVDMRMTSQGRITPTRLWPEAYEEERRGKKRGVRFGDQVLTLSNGQTVNRVPHLQDTASQFVQLAQDFSTGRMPLVVGGVVPVTLGRPGGVDDWMYDVVANETVSTTMGPVAAYHLKPRPLANPRGTVSAEIWFAPTLQHLPVRIRLTLNPETWLDLTLDSAQLAD